ncbi:maltose O-acetyltransferase, partial [Lecanoromycetidae sp. Uapishka_2]
MAEVASNHVGESSRGHENDHLAEPTPSFTAVNGTPSPAPPAKARLQSEPQKEGTEVTNHRALLPNNNHEAAITSRQDPPNNVPATANQERRSSPPPVTSQSVPPNVPQALAPAPVQGSKPPTPAPVAIQPAERPPSRPSQYAEMSTDTRTQYSNGHSRNSSSQQANGNMMSPSTQKRKRSFDGEMERRPEYEHAAHAYHMNGPPPSPGGQRIHDMDNGHPRDRQHDGYRQSYPPPPSGSSYPPPPQDGYAAPPRMRESPPEIYPRPDRHQLVPTRHEYEQPVDPSIAPAPPRPYYSDPQEAHLANALQRENRGYDTMGPRDHIQYGSPEDDDDPHGQYYGADRSSQDLDRKRRKRVFSNRTKTGCMTCRRRKKKCDEQHPECNNCLRGGFVCEGYTMRNTWQKPANAKQPIPLQSKNGYGPPQGTPGRTTYQAPRYQDVSPEYPGPPPQQGHRQSYDQGDRSKPINIEDEREGVYGRASPPEGQQKSAYGKAVRPYPSNPPHMSKYQSENGHRGSIYENPPDSQDQSMHPPASVHRTNSTASQYAIAPHPPNHNNTPPSHNNVQAIAQAAATHPASHRPSPQSRNTERFTEREKMLKGLYYYPLTPALTEDREHCIAAIWRFNNATNPSHGASPEERCRLFQRILQLRPTPEPPGANGEVPRPNMDLPFGSVGERVVVEAPFHCDYGYNITVGDDVLIGADCRISDTCSVTIGARCIFSPNVKLVCATYPIDPRRRMGSNGPALGRNIVIEEDCWIGSNVTILAGVRVGKSSTVGAGSLLHQDVPRFTVVAGNPAKVSRGIYDGNADGQ